MIERHLERAGLARVLADTAHAALQIALSVVG